jgi:putative ABC transport system permease protein
MFAHYLLIALRNLRRAPVTALINVASLALGLVSFITAYAVVGYWSNSERHFENAQRTYVITAQLALRDGSIATGTMPVTTELYRRYLELDFPEFEAIARANVWSREASVSIDGRGARVFAVAVDPEFLDIFPLPFVAGDRGTALREPNGVLLTEAAAVRLFGTRDAVGRAITLGGNLIDATVTGVIGTIPEPSHMGTSAAASLRFDLVAPHDLYDRLRTAVSTPSSAAPDASDEAGEPPSTRDSADSAENQRTARSAATPAQPENWLGGYCCTTYVMLERGSGLTEAALDARLEDFARRRVPAEQQALANLEIGAVPLRGLMVTLLDAQLLGAAAGVLSITTMLFALGTLVLVVACVNYANLATARAMRRAREIGLRKVVGASRRQIVAQYLFEAGLLTLAALAIATAAVYLVAPVIAGAVGIDVRLALFAGVGFWLFIVALLTGVTLLGGAYPALVLSRVRPIEALRLGRVRIGPRFASTLLVGTQFAAASFLLIAVIIMYTQNAALKRTGLGATSDPHLIINNFSRVTGVDNEILRAELARLPQVESVTEMNQAPWSDSVNLAVLARSPDQEAAFRTSFQNMVGYDFFATLGIRLIAGRVFDRDRNDLLPQNADDMDPPPTRNIVIDNLLAAELGFGTAEEAVDEIVYSPSFRDRPAQPNRIIGVVESKPLFLRGFGATSNAYLLGSDMTNQIVRLTADDVSGGLAAIEEVWRALAPQSPLTRRFMDEMFNETYEEFARINQVFVGLAVFAFVISTIGLFGMAVQVAGRRVHEIGVRKSVGARKGQIVMMLLRDFSKPVIVANLIAWPLGFIAAQAYLSVFIQRIGITPLPFVMSLAIVVSIAWGAVGSQALRAARVNPANVLRFE